MYYIDTHCHIYKGACDNIDQTVLNALNNNVGKMINCSEDLDTSREIIELSKQYKDVLYPTVGIHPEYADETSNIDIEEMEEIIKSNKVYAIGEIGLDYYYTKENRIEQIELFKAQLYLAQKYNLPVIIHSREATKDTIDILSMFNVKGIIHSFSGSYETAQEYIKMGFLLGINGVVTFKNSNLKDVVGRINLDNLVLETDSPFLAPHPLRGTVNSPQNIPIISDYLAELFGVSSDTIMSKTTQNALRLFDI